jgi:hypothetical protein
MRLTVILLAFLFSVDQAAAQTTLEINVGGGYNVTSGGVKSQLGNGANFDVGLTIRPHPVVGFQVQYGYTSLAGRDFRVPVSTTPGGPEALQDFSAYTLMHGISFDAVFRPNLPLRPYFVAGPGVYHRTANVTTRATGFASLCEPHSYVCFPDPVPVSEIVGSRSSADFGANIGGGVTFRLAGLKTYVEIRYLYVGGPEMTLPASSTSGKADARFIPITFGLRF